MSHQNGSARMWLIVTRAFPSSTSHADPAGKSHPQESLPEAPTQNSRQRRNPSSRQPAASRPPIPSARFRPRRPRNQAKMRIIAIIASIGQLLLALDLLWQMAPWLIWLSLENVRPTDTRASRYPNYYIAPILPSHCPTEPCRLHFCSWQLHQQSAASLSLHLHSIMPQQAINCAMKNKTETDISDISS